MHRWLAVLAAVALAAGGVWWALAADEPGDDGDGGRSSSGVADSPGAPAAKRPDAELAPGQPNAPVVTSTARSGTRVRPPAAGDGAPREYAIGDVRVRDHRTGERAPVDLPPNIHVPGTRRIAASLTGDIAAKMRGVMAECVASIPAEARGVKPRLEGTVVIAIKDRQAQITSSTVQLRDIVGASAEAAKLCIERASVGQSTPAAGEDDLDSYSISLSFAIL